MKLASPRQVLSQAHCPPTPHRPPPAPREEPSLPATAGKAPQAALGAPLTPVAPPLSPGGALATRLARPEGGGPVPLVWGRGMQGPIAQVGSRATRRLDNQIPKECPREQGGPGAEGPPPWVIAPRQVVAASATTLFPAGDLRTSPPHHGHCTLSPRGLGGQHASPPRSGFSGA
ncbi:Hypothetical predicted protein [Marmota monax]|uniref:Uncharacterized protein n=1 Tax=Marmota monax TaxID=9995 RepID=A0A5E4BV08_MARMO|nr:Hypothetical predicted protein [Marmota monax]